MGSVVVSDVVSDPTRFPHAMMVMNRHHESSPAGADRHRHAGAGSDSRRSSQQHRSSTSDSYASTSDPPAQASPKSAHASAPIDVPGARSRAPHAASSEEEGSEEEKPGAQRRPERQPDEEPPAQRARGSSAGYHSSPPSPELRPADQGVMSLNTSGAASPTKIVVRDLNHIQSFASEEMLARSRQNSRRSLRGRMEGSQQYEISNMPVTDIIEMVAGLLTKITTTNDRPHQHENLQRHLPSGDSVGTAMQQQTQSVLSFHGRNIPSITILSYLSRIHRYCPTTYEVFLSLLVYFDRMTEKINNGTLKSFRSVEEAFGNSSGSGNGTNIQTPPASGSVRPQDQEQSSEHEASLVDSDDDDDDPDKPPKHMFVVDSFNIHRLVIAGVTCASKFFSDVFYTNSRYAKVGGLPIHELNHLELQFLLLNDFRLSVPVEELEAYGSRLVEFYAREVVAQQQGNGGSGSGSGGGGSSSGHGHGNGHDALYMGSVRNPPT